MISVLQSPQVGTNGSATVALGWDCGNGYSKLASDAGEILMPSYFCQIFNGQEYERQDEVGAVIEYVEGCRSDLHNTRWLIGETASIAKPLHLQRIVDAPDNKIRFGLQMLLGCLAEIPGEKFFIVASIPDAQTHGAALKDSLSGRHVARINGKTRSFHLIVKVAEEGIGAIAAVRKDAKHKIALIDLGHGTTIATLFDGNKLVSDGRAVFAIGVHDLLMAIAENPDFRKLLGKPADLHLIREGIKSGFYYGKRLGLNFRDCYDQELRQWATGALAPAIKKLAPWEDSLDGFYAIGGGSQLPKISEALVKRGIMPIDEPQNANARGLLKLAKQMGVR